VAGGLTDRCTDAPVRPRCTLRPKAFADKHVDGGQHILDITITASVVAWYAAIVSTCSLTISAYVALRDRARLKVEASPDYFVTGPAAGYDPNKKYILVTVASIGRRPVTIEKVALMRKKGLGGHHLLADSLSKGPRELTEGKSATYLLEQSRIDFDEIDHAVAIDSTGRHWRGKVSKPK